MERRAWTLLIVLAAIWGASYLFIKIGVRDMSPALIAWLRLALAAAVLVPLAARRGALRAARGIGAGWLAILAITQVGGPFVLIGAAEQEISSGLAGILVASTPLFTAVLAIWIDHEERSQGLRLVGILLGLAGVALLLGVDLGGSGAELLGGFAVVAAGLCYSVGGFVAKRRIGVAAPLGVAAWVMIAATALLAPPALLSLPDEAPGVGPLAAVAVLGVVGTIGPARTWIVTYLAPGFAVAYGAIFLDEAITVSTLAGLALIIGGSYLAAGGSPATDRAGERVAAAKAPG
jgi:drug/metabolite transporter (DMT)-like permease